MWFLCSGMFTVSSTVKGNIVTQCYKAFNQMKTNGEHDAAESLWGAGGWKTFGHAGKNDTFYRRDSFILCICSTVQRMNFFSFNQRLNIFLKSNHVYRVDLLLFCWKCTERCSFFYAAKEHHGWEKRSAEESETSVSGSAPLFLSDVREALLCSWLRQRWRGNRLAVNSINGYVPVCVFAFLQTSWI